MSNQPMNVIRFHVYKTPIGIFVRNLWGNLYPRHNTTNHQFDQYRFNGNVVGNNDALRGGFFHLPTVHHIERVETFKSESREFSHLKLIEPALASDKIPLELHCNHYWDSDNDVWTTGDDELDKIISLYSREYKVVPGHWVDRQFEVIELGVLDVQEFNNPIQMMVKSQQDGTFNSGKVIETDLESITSWSDIEHMLTPEFLLHERPCSLSSEQLYRVIRAYIKEHINPHYARIDSDYDFCLRVVKVIAVKPWTKSIEQKTKRNQSFRPPKFTTTTVNTSVVKCFEAAPKEHSGIKPVEPMNAPNLATLAKNLKQYLDELMDVINAPVVQCSCCNGTGHIIERATFGPSRGD